MAPKRPHQRNSANTNDRVKKHKQFEGDYKSDSALRNALHGTIFQLKLLMLFIKRGLSKGYPYFQMATEMDAAMKFDDLVFQYQETEKGALKCIFLQAKHKQDALKKITEKDLLKETDDGEFALAKYFYSYRRIKESKEFRHR